MQFLVFVDVAMTFVVTAASVNTAASKTVSSSLLVGCCDGEVPFPLIVL